MTIVDVLGNTLEKNDLVCVTQGDQQLLGLVLAINEPSVLAPSKNQMDMSGQVQIGLMPLTILYNVRQPRLINVIKVVKPPNFQKKES